MHLFKFFQFQRNIFHRISIFYVGRIVWRVELTSKWAKLFVLDWVEWLKPLIEVIYILADNHLLGSLFFEPVFSTLFAWRFGALNDLLDLLNNAISICTTWNKKEDKDQLIGKALIQKNMIRKFSPRFQRNFWSWSSTHSPSPINDFPLKSTSSSV